MPPQGFPVPSYASNTFFKQATRFFRVVAELLAPLRYPNGPVVLLQVDNEGAMYFRDAIYDQDYHPDAVALYRRFLAKKYGPKASPSEVYGRGGASFHALEPPKSWTQSASKTSLSISTGPSSRSTWSPDFFAGRASA